MKNRTAGLLFLLVCDVLAILLLAKVIKIFFSGIFFAIAVLLIVLLLRGFRK